MGIILGPSQHPTDVPFVSEFWWGTYGLPAISPRKQQISVKFHIYKITNFNVTRQRARHSLRAYIAGCPPDTHATHLVLKLKFGSQKIKLDLQRAVTHASLYLLSDRGAEWNAQIAVHPPGTRVLLCTTTSLKGVISCSC